MDTLEGNKLISEFMGATPCQDWQGYDGYDHPDYIHSQWSNKFQDTLELTSYRYSDLKYHSSWDWLMPVVEKICKIEDGRFSVDISSVGMWACFIKRDDNFENIIADFGGYEPMILNVYHSVVKFIKWYNKNKQ